MLRLSVLKPHSEMVILSWLAGLFTRWNHICGSIELKRGQLIVVLHMVIDADTGISTCSYRNSPGLKNTHKSLWLVTSYWHILIGSVVVELCCHTAPPLWHWLSDFSCGFWLGRLLWLCRFFRFSCGFLGLFWRGRRWGRLFLLIIIRSSVTKLVTTRPPGISNSGRRVVDLKFRMRTSQIYIV